METLSQWRRMTNTIFTLTNLKRRRWWKAHTKHIQTHNHTHTLYREKWNMQIYEISIPKSIWLLNFICIVYGIDNTICAFYRSSVLLQAYFQLWCENGDKTWKFSQKTMRFDWGMGRTRMQNKKKKMILYIHRTQEIRKRIKTTTKRKRMNLFCFIFLWHREKLVL